MHGVPTWKAASSRVDPLYGAHDSRGEPHRLCARLRDRLTAQVGQEFAGMPAGMDRAIAEEAEDRTTDVVRRFTRRRPHSFRAVAERELTGGSGGNAFSQTVIRACPLG